MANECIILAKTMMPSGKGVVFHIARITTPLADGVKAVVELMHQKAIS